LTFYTFSPQAPFQAETRLLYFSLASDSEFSILRRGWSALGGRC
jgi:hypothetical protein